MIKQIKSRCVEFPSLSAKPYKEMIIERNVRVIYTVTDGYAGSSEPGGGPQSEPSLSPQVKIDKVLMESEGGWREMSTSKEEDLELTDQILEDL